ncbi:hypothetical protein BaRGS_00000465 [Batillaria attramentaria]|uniref:Uncharacterized protein n=1 Tax=Batillaria attramentaria TaxID=370345 RepID=A0ABD0M9V2_9CAEN
MNGVERPSVGAWDPHYVTSHVVVRTEGKQGRCSRDRLSEDPQAGQNKRKVRQCCRVVRVFVCLSGLPCALERFQLASAGTRFCLRLLATCPDTMFRPVSGRENCLFPSVASFLSTAKPSSTD